jgi:hypothetical protein
MNVSKVVLGAVVALISVTSVQAGFTSIGSPPSGELNQERILEGIYGGNFVVSGHNFSNGTVSAVRVEDTPFTSGSSQSVIGPITTSDQVWHDGFVQASAEAKYAAYTGETFGYFGGADGGSYTKLLDISGSGFSVTGQTDLIDARGQTWRWGQGHNGLFGQVVHSSRESNNFGLDYLVSYQIRGLADQGDETTWLLFWEDMLPGCSSDYNDVVVEVKASCMNPTPVPVPGAVILGAMGLSIVGWYQRRKLA